MIVNGEAEPGGVCTVSIGKSNWHCRPAHGFTIFLLRYRSLSFSLGRPAAAHDDDSDVELPPAISEQTVGAVMEAFFALSELYVISGKVERIQCVSRLRDMANPSKAGAMSQMVQAIDGDLEAWHNRFGQNFVREDLALWTVATFLYSAIILNLHRCVLIAFVYFPLHLKFALLMSCEGSLFQMLKNPT